MAKTQPMIVTMKYDEDVDEFAADVGDFASSMLDDVEVTDAMTADAFGGAKHTPSDDEVKVNADAGMFYADLTDSQVKKLEKDKNVEAVEEDALVFASDLGGTFDQLGEFSALEPDEEAVEDIEAWTADLDSDWEEYGEDIVSEAEADRLMLHEADIGDALQFEPGFEDQFDEDLAIDDVADYTADEMGTSGIPRKEIIKLVKCVLKCAVAQAGSLENVSAEDIDAALSASGVGAGDVQAAASDHITCGLKVIYATYAWRYSRGNRARVAVLDTGIDPRHPDLRVYGGISYVPGVRSWVDDHYHGTHVAGTIAALANRRGVVGVAPQARLYAIKVLNSRGSGRTSWIINGLTICARARIHVANLSLGSRVNTHNPRVYSAAFERAGRVFARSGGLAVAAAGNDRRRPVGNPARCPSFMAVSAVDCRRRLASFTNIGPQVEICGPGVGTVSTVPGGRYRSLSGTSMATPHVAGAAALVKARRPTRSGTSIRIHLRRTALDLGRTGWDPYFGFGLVNAYRAARYA